MGGRVRWGGAVRVRYTQAIFWERKCHFHNVLFEVLFAHPRGLSSQLCYALEFLGELSAWVPPRGACNWHGGGPERDSEKASQMASVYSQEGHLLLRSHIPSSQRQWKAKAWGRFEPEDSAPHLISALLSGWDTAQESA